MLLVQRLFNHLISDEESAKTFSGNKHIKIETDAKTKTEIASAEELQNNTANENAMYDSINTNDKKINVDYLINAGCFRCD